MSTESQTFNRNVASPAKSEIHPAFRWPSAVAGSPYFDPNVLAAYYPGIMFNPLTSMMCIPPAALWVNRPVSGTEHLQTASKQISCVNSDVNIKKGGPS